MSNNECLRLMRLLAEKAPELSVRYELIAQQLKENVQKHIASILMLPDHGERHHDTVEQNVDLLLPPEEKERMSPEEIFVLLCSVHFHGIGLLVDAQPDGYTRPAVSEYHRTYDYISEHYSEWELNIHEARLIKQVCSGLEEADYRSLPEYEVLHRSRVRVRYLSALLRLADALDMDYTRISNYVMKLRRLSPASSTQWLKYTDISGILIDSKRWLIDVYIAPKTVEGRAILTEFIEESAQNALGFVKDVLEANGLHYRTISVHLAHEIAERDSRVIAALNDYYGLSALMERRNPYKFLDYFKPSERDIFFGRNGDIQRFLGYVRAEKLVVLYGESGVGKTSLINAGLVPELIERGFVPVYTRCFEEPSSVIKKEIIRVVSHIDHRVGTSPETDLVALVEQLASRGYELVVFLDQFEEFFVKFPEELRHGFIRELIGCLVAGVSITFVLSLRREFFVELGRYKSELLELYGNAHELCKLTRDEVTQAIEAPARQCGIRFDDDVLEQLVTDIYRDGEYNTPHIQIVCDKLVRSLGLDGEVRAISVGLYERLGRASKILGEYLEAEVSRFSLGVRDKVKAVLKEVVTSHGTKIPATAETIFLHTGIAQHVVTELLQDLVNRCRLLRRIDLEDRVVYELAHEYLVDQVWEWLDEEEIELKRVYEMLDQQLVARDRFGIRLNMDALAQVEVHRDSLALDDERKKLILESYMMNAPTSAEKRFWIDSLGRDMAADLLIETLHSADKATYEESVRVLGQIGEEVIEKLITSLDTSNWKVRHGLIEALAEIGPSALGSLLAHLDHMSRYVRRGVVTVLAMLGGIAEERLQQLSESSKGQVRASVADSLRLMRHYASRHSIDHSLART